MPNFSERALTEFAVALLMAGGLASEEAELVGHSLVAANLRGYDSHGVLRIAMYLTSIGKGEIVPGAPFTVLSENATLLAADGHWGLGQPQASRLLDRLIVKTQAQGSAVGTLVHCGHVGRLGDYCERAAAVGLVSMLMVNTHGHARRVAPPGGKAARLGTNPIAFGAPRGDAPLVLDFSTSATAEGKVRVKNLAGARRPDGWLLDSEGRPTNDPAALYADPPGTILPMGGDQAYKGFGLALMVEIFAGALSGGACIREKPINQNGNCVFMLLVDPGHSGGRAHFTHEVADLAEFVLNCPRVAGAGEILLPGDIERRTLAQREARGIPLDDGNWAALAKLAERFDVPLPATI